MPLAEHTIAELMLRRLVKEIDPGECRELEDWAGQSAANQQTLEELSKPENLKKKLRDFYDNITGQPTANLPGQTFHDPISSASMDTGFSVLRLRASRPYFPHPGKK